MQTSELIILAALMLIFAGIAGARWLLRSAWLPEQMKERHIDICLVLLCLIQDVQRHRALSGAILDGRKEFRAEREATELRLQRSLHAVAEQYGDRHTIFRQPPWRLTLGHWAALHNNWQSLDFFTSLVAHSDVVSEMIGVLRSLADSLRLRLGESRTRVLSDWPAIAEHIGMLRALGLHALAGTVDTDQSQLDKLVNLHLRISRKSLEEVRAEDADLALLARTRRALDRVEWLMDGNSDRYHPYTFYEEMTGVIDDWYSTTRQRLRGEETQSNWFGQLSKARRAPARTG